MALARAQSDIMTPPPLIIPASCARTHALHAHHLCSVLPAPSHSSGSIMAQLSSAHALISTMTMEVTSLAFPALMTALLA